MSETPKKPEVPKRVAECLYRYSNGNHSALVKVRSKQIKRSLKTNDLAIAKRRLSELRKKAERMHGRDTRDIRFQELSGMWMKSVKSKLKDASHDRRRGRICCLTRGNPVRIHPDFPSHGAVALDAKGQSILRRRFSHGANGYPSFRTLSGSCQSVRQC